MTPSEQVILIEALILGAELGACATEMAEQLARVWRVDPMLRQGIIDGVSNELQQLMVRTRNA